MKKIIAFLIVLNVLTAGISYYIYEMQSAVLLEEDIPQNLEGPVKVHHPHWGPVDEIIPDEGNHIHRKANGDTGIITDITYNTFTIIWDGYGIEVFTRNLDSDVYDLTEKK